MFRILIGILAGLAVAFACIALIQMLDGRLYPVAPGTDPNTVAAAAHIMASIPFTAKLLIVAAWCVGTLAGGLVAVLIGHRGLCAWVVAGAVVARALATVAAIPHPAWMVACGLLLPWGCAWLVKCAAHWRRPA